MGRTGSELAPAARDINIAQLVLTRVASSAVIVYSSCVCPFSQLNHLAPTTYPTTMVYLDLISARINQRKAAATGTVQAAAYIGSGPGGGPRSSVSGATSLSFGWPVILQQNDAMEVQTSPPDHLLSQETHLYFFVHAFHGDHCSQNVHRGFPRGRC